MKILNNLKFLRSEHWFTISSILSIFWCIKAKTFFFYIFRNVGNLLLVVPSLTTRVNPSARLTITWKGVRCAQAVINRFQADASLLCSGNSILNILCALSAWNNSTRARSRNKTTNPTVICVSRNYSVSRDGGTYPTLANFITIHFYMGQFSVYKGVCKR